MSEILTINGVAERRGNPYLASKRANSGFWYDSFAKNGKIVWIVFRGTEMLAQVCNRQQCENLIRWLK